MWVAQPAAAEAESHSSPGVSPSSRTAFGFLKNSTLSARSCGEAPRQLRFTLE